MPSAKFDHIDRVKAVEREYRAVRLAADRLRHDVDHAATALRNDLRVRDLRAASDRLEGTYVIRLFAEFEASLRSLWRASRKKEPPSRTRDLLDGIGAQHRISNDLIADAHQVRRYRNELVHIGEAIAAVIAIATVRSRLCRYLSFLPLWW
jgi:hypothetical protein